MGTTLAADRIAAADEYLAARTGCYEWRCERYDAARDAMWQANSDDAVWGTLFDVGAGATEFGRYLFKTRFTGRYFPVDACIDGTDLDEWTPPRSAEFFVALEVIEHLSDPWRLLEAMCERATRAVIVSTPNPYTTDVLAMDPTHRTPIYPRQLEAFGFDVEARSFYGKPDDSLFGVWVP